MELYRTYSFVSGFLCETVFLSYSCYFTCIRIPGTLCKHITTDGHLSYLPFLSSSEHSYTSRYRLSFLLGKWVEVQSPGHKIDIYWTKLEIVKQYFPKWLHYCAFSAAKYDCCSCSTSSTFPFSHSDGCVVLSHFFCFSDYRLLIISVTFSYAYRPFQYQLFLIGFLKIINTQEFFIYDWSPLPDICSASIFSQYVHGAHCAKVKEIMISNN